MQERVPGKVITDCRVKYGVLGSIQANYLHDRKTQTAASHTPLGTVFMHPMLQVAQKVPEVQLIVWDIPVFSFLESNSLVTEMAVHQDPMHRS